MISQDRIKASATWTKDVEHLLPKITSLILEGIHSYVDDNDIYIESTGHQQENILDAPGNGPPAGQPQLPKTKPLSRSGSERYPLQQPIWINHYHDSIPSVRSFLGGFSHCFNNVLMGIWGNTSLIRLLLEESDSIQPHLGQIEDLIQNGSNLIHQLLGYVVERRSMAQKIRLKQLRQEIKAYNQINGNDLDFAIIETSISELSNIQTRSEMAACISRVATQMLMLIQKKRSSIDGGRLACAKAAALLGKIDMLLERGSHMIVNLQYYAGVRIPIRKETSMRSLLQTLLAKWIEAKPEVKFNFDHISDLPLITVDPNQISHALEQLIDNAVRAISHDGNIDVVLNTIHSESPEERCGVHTIGNYVVISVKDNGKGMATIDQAQIFDPFFTGHKGHSRPGLGLAAAAGIIRSHGGYIQVRSKQEEGSVFKLYLPTP